MTPVADMNAEAAVSASTETPGLAVTPHLVPAMRAMAKTNSSENTCIAVVDDDPAVLRSLGRLLRAHGYDARTYLSAQALLAEVAALRPSCIIADLMMPGVGGLEFQQSLVDAGLAFPLVFHHGARRHSFVRLGDAPWCRRFSLEAFRRERAVRSDHPRVGA